MKKIEPGIAAQTIALMRSCLIVCVVAIISAITLELCYTKSVNAEERYKNVLQPGGSTEKMQESSKGCLDCHLKTDAPTMHENPAVQIGCAECHGGNPTIRANGLKTDDPAYQAAKRLAHVLPTYPESWPSSANPKTPIPS